MELLYHYYDQAIGPLSRPEDIHEEDRELFLAGVRESGDIRAARSIDNYNARRAELEAQAREYLKEQGGAPVLTRPYLFAVGPCRWLKTWYKRPGVARIAADQLDPYVMTFTFGDIVTTFGPRAKDGKEYRKKIYTFEGIEEVIAKYGLPQIWNDVGKHGPERFVEVQVWVEEAAKLLSVFED